MTTKQTIAKLAESPVIVTSPSTLEVSADCARGQLLGWLQDAAHYGRGGSVDNVRASVPLSAESAAVLSRVTARACSNVAMYNWPWLDSHSTFVNDVAFSAALTSLPEFTQLIGKLRDMTQPVPEALQVKLGTFYVSLKDAQKVAIDTGLPSTASADKASVVALATGKAVGVLLAANTGVEYYVVGLPAEFDRITRALARYATQHNESKLSESPTIMSDPAVIEFVIDLSPGTGRIRAEVNDYSRSYAPTDKVRLVKPLSPESYQKFIAVNKGAKADGSLSCYFNWPSLEAPHLNHAPVHADEAAFIEQERVTSEVLKSTPEFAEMVAKLNRLIATDQHTVKKVEVETRVVKYDALPEILAELGLSGARNPEKVTRFAAATGRSIIQFHSKVGYDTGPFYIAATDGEREKFMRHLARLEVAKEESTKQLVAGLLESPIVLDSGDAVYIIGEYTSCAHAVGIEVRDADSELVYRKALVTGPLSRVDANDGSELYTTTFQFPDDPARSSSEFMLSYSGQNRTDVAHADALYSLPEFRKLWDDAVRTIELVDVRSCINRIPQNVSLGSRTLEVLSNAGLTVTNRIHVAAAAASKSGTGVHRFKGRGSDNLWVIGTDKDVEKAKRVFAKLSVEKGDTQDD